MQTPASTSAQPPPSSPEETVTEASTGGQTSVATIAQKAPSLQDGSPPSPSVPTTNRQGTGEDLYDYRKCTIFIVVQLRPEVEAGQPRRVLLSVQNGVSNKEDLPLYRLLSEEQLGGPFPPALVALLEELQQQLPERKQRHDERQEAKRRQEAERESRGQAGKAAQRAAQSATGTKATSRQHPAPATNTASVVPPVPPTTTNPIPKQELQQGGLFDEL
jgi:hypothetical protein